MVDPALTLSFNKYFLVVAGGIGSRMNAETPKQFLPINGRPVILHTLQRLIEADSDTKLILVLPENQMDYWDTVSNKMGFIFPAKLVIGGENRFQSVKNGLDTISGDGVVAIHDGVRPFFRSELIQEGFESAAKDGAAIPVIDMRSSVISMADDKIEPADRSQLKSVQTPQFFKLKLIKKAYEQEHDMLFTDDASVAAAAGIPLQLLEGNAENLKITTPFDLELAQKIAEVFEK